MIYTAQEFINFLCNECRMQKITGLAPESGSAVSWAFSWTSPKEKDVFIIYIRQHIPSNLYIQVYKNKAWNVSCEFPLPSDLDTIVKFLIGELK